MNPDQFNAIVALLESHLATVADRRALFDSALYNHPALKAMQWEGETHAFTVHGVNTLMAKGGTEAIIQLLEKLKQQTGDQPRRDIDALIATLHDTANGITALSFRERLIAHGHAVVKELFETSNWKEHFIQEEARFLPMYASAYEEGVLRGQPQNLLNQLKKRQYTIVLGEPGSGKTVALERLAWELAHQDKPVTPVFIRLLAYDGRPLLEWVQESLISSGHVRFDTTQDTDQFLKDATYTCYIMLDGLNEVRPAFREQIVDEITRFAMTFANHKMVVTSRVQDDNWSFLRQTSRLREVLLVQPIRPEQAEAYLLDYLKDDGAILWRQLTDAANRRLLELSSSPLMLWLMKEAWLEAKERYKTGRVQMPDNRGALYQQFIARLLRRERDRRLHTVDDTIIIRTLSHLALTYHKDKTLSCPLADVRRIIKDDKLLSVIRRSGLLIGEDDLRFAPHQTMQEHFAARAMQDYVMVQTRKQITSSNLTQPIMVYTKVLGKASDNWWWETYIQLAGIARDANALARALAERQPWLAWWCVQEGQEVEEATREVIYEQTEARVTSNVAEERRRAAEVLAAMRSERVITPLARLSIDSDEATVRIAMPALMKMGEAGERAFSEQLLSLKPHERATYGIVLSKIDDPRKGVGEITKYSNKLPDIDWVPIPAGPFIMGSEFNNNPNRKEEVNYNYLVSRYLVTYRQYQCFIDDRYGYRNPEWWQGLSMPDDHNTQPRTQAFKYWNHPRENVSWYEAIAFCRWFSARLGGPYRLDDVTAWRVRLPTEQEWEKAARGTDGLEYPWGNKFNARRCNNRVESTYRIGQTSAVGLFPDGTSPYGVHDMGGNVWEWCLNVYSDGSIKLGINDIRVLKGGSWNDVNANYFRSAFRYGGDSYLWSDNVGFRVARSYNS